jgi:hypothetical protein
MNKKTFIVLLAFTLAFMVTLSGCFVSGTTRGNGKMLNGEFLLSDKDDRTVIYKVKRVEARNVAATFVLMPDSRDRVNFVIDDNLFDYLLMELTDDGTLIISTEGNRKLTSHKEISVTIGAGDLEAITLTGAANLISDKPLSLDRLSIKAVGATNVELEGSVNRLTIEVEGATNMNLKRLNAADVEIDASGAAHIEVAAEKTLNVKMRGAGIIKYWGDPQITKDFTAVGKLTGVLEKGE